MLGGFALLYQKSGVTAYTKGYAGAQYVSSAVITSRLEGVAAAARSVAIPLKKYLHGTWSVA
jgi:hypothetical protein